jgi:hypothetical protein
MTNLEEHAQMFQANKLIKIKHYAKQLEKLDKKAIIEIKLDDGRGGETDYIILDKDSIKLLSELIAV